MIDFVDPNGPAAAAGMLPYRNRVVEGMSPYVVVAVNGEPAQGEKAGALLDATKTPHQRFSLQLKPLPKTRDLDDAALERAFASLST